MLHGGTQTHRHTDTHRHTRTHARTHAHTHARTNVSKRKAKAQPAVGEDSGRCEDGKWDVPEHHHAEQNVLKKTVLCLNATAHPKQGSK